MSEINETFYENLEKRGVPKIEIEKLKNFFKDTEDFRIFLENEKQRQIQNQKEWISDVLDVFLMALGKVNRPESLIKLINCYNVLWEKIASLSDGKFIVNNPDKKIY